MDSSALRHFGLGPISPYVDLVMGHFSLMWWVSAKFFTPFPTDIICCICLEVLACMFDKDTD